MCQRRNVRRLLFRRPNLAIAWCIGSTIPFCLSTVPSDATALTIKAEPVTAPAASFSLPWDSEQNIFVTCMARDHDGNIWVGTEDRGVWKHAPGENLGKSQWTQYDSKSGLGDDSCYTLLCDRSGCVWVGTLNHGVSVYNGTTWHNYAITSGLPGLHVTALAVNPLNNDVWGGTEGGLFCYSVGKHTWRTYGKEQGLHSDAATALCFDNHGNLYVGTESDGIAVGTPNNGYTQWRITKGPVQVPNASGGAGLPTSLINCLCCVTDPKKSDGSSSDTVYAGTTTGLAKTTDGGVTWTYIRGADWPDKIKGLINGEKIKVAENFPIQSLLLEDYVSCLADVGDGRILIGHRQQTVESFDTNKNVRVAPLQNVTSVYATALLPIGDYNVLVGIYGDKGVLTDRVLGTVAVTPIVDTSAITQNVLPSSISPPKLAELSELLKKVESVPVDSKELYPKVIALNDDWLTQGNWLGRFGRYWACLCAAQGDENYIWGSGWEPVASSFFIGPNHDTKIKMNDRRVGDELRYFVHWTYTKNIHALELPAPYVDNRVKDHSTTLEEGRRESEIDDHGEAYPMSLDGPSIFVKLHIPHGLFYLSLYEFNKDGHTENNSLRDYSLSVWKREPNIPIKALSPFPSEIDDAHGRVRGFWGGVYKRFMVRGPINLIVKVDKNYSKNAILQSIMLDEVSEKPAPYFLTPEQELVQTVENRTSAKVKVSQLRKHAFQPAISESEAANRLFSDLQDLELVNSAWWAMYGQPYYATLLRWYQSQETLSSNNKILEQRIATCLYQTNQFSMWEKYQNKAGMTTARQIEQALRWKEGNLEMFGFDTVSTYVDGQPKH